MAEGDGGPQLTPTGRRIVGPAVDLIEATSAKGLKHLTLTHHSTWLDQPGLNVELQAALGWMEAPDVSGLARMVHHDPDQGAFTYATGTVWSVAEVVRMLAETNEGAGVKAGLELCYLVGEILSETLDAAQQHGVSGHGNINPWTVLIKADAQPLLLGYGIPQVEIRAWLENSKRVPKEDSFRYAPPERLDGEAEDLSSDLFSLALVGLELMMGKPVYDGLLNDIRQQAARGEGVRRLYQWREKLPSNVREVMGRALKPDPDTRYRDGMDFVYALHDLLGSIDVDGPSLLEVITRVKAVEARGKGPIEGGKTGMLTAAEMAEMAADIDDVDDKPLPPPKKPRPAVEEEPVPDGEQPRWGKVSRPGARRPEPPPPVVAPPPPAPASARDRLRQRLRGSGEATGVVPEPPQPPEPTTSTVDARERLKRRLSERTSTATPAPAAPERVAAPPRELRRSRGTETGVVPAAPRERAARRAANALDIDHSLSEDLVLIDEGAEDLGRELVSEADLSDLLEADDAPPEPPPPQPPPPPPPPQPPPTLPPPASSPPVPVVADLVASQAVEAAPPPAEPSGPHIPMETTGGFELPAETTDEIRARVQRTSGAAALLEQLRGSGRRGRRRSSRDDVGDAQGPSVDEPSMTRPPQLPIPGGAVPAVPGGAMSGGEAASGEAAMGGEAKSGEALAVEAIAPSPPPIPSQRPSAHTAQSTQVARPQLLPANPVSPVLFRCGARELAVTADGEEVLSTMCLRAALATGALRFDSTGHLTASFRCVLPDGWRGARDPAAAALAGTVIRLESAAVSVRVVDFHVQDGSGVARLRTAVNDGLPSSWLARQLTELLRLDGEWRVADAAGPLPVDAPIGEATSASLWLIPA